MKKIFIKKVLSVSITTLLFAQVLYVVAEPTVAVALNPDDVVVTLNVTSGVSLSDGLAATMSPNIGTVYSKSVGSSSWVVATNNAAGYTLVVHASNTPALKKPAIPGAADEFADYTNVGGVPDTWGGVASNAKEFGFSARGTDALAAFGNTATTCGNTSTGVVDAASKYEGFSGASDIQIATNPTITTPSGVQTYICFAAEQGSGIFAASGTYTATITATASTL